MEQELLEFKITSPKPQSKIVIFSNIKDEIFPIIDHNVLSSRVLEATKKNLNLSSKILDL